MRRRKRSAARPAGNEPIATYLGILFVFEELELHGPGALAFDVDAARTDLAPPLTAQPTRAARPHIRAA